MAAEAEARRRLREARGRLRLGGGQLGVGGGVDLPLPTLVTKLEVGWRLLATHMFTALQYQSGFCVRLVQYR